MTQINLTEVLPGDPREWSPRDKPNVKNYSFKVKDDKGTVYEISTKGDPPKLGVGEFNVTPPKPGTSFPPKLSRVFQGGGGGRGRSPEETKRIERMACHKTAAQILGTIVKWGGTEEAYLANFKRITDWLVADVGSGLGGGASSGGAASIAPAPLPPQNAAAESSAATANQKRAITTALNKAGVSRDFQTSIVHGIADPLDKAGASRILDVLNDEAHSLQDRVETLIALSGAKAPEDFPPDMTDLPPLEVA